MDIRKSRQLRIASTLVYFRQGGTGIASDYLQRFAKICFSEPKIVNGFAIYELNGDFLITNTKTQGCTNKTVVSRFVRKNLPVLRKIGEEKT